MTQNFTYENNETSESPLNETVPNSDEKNSHRSKISAACEYCRTNHRKCNGAKPTCSNCEKKGRKCEYVPRKKRGPKKRTRPESLSNEGPQKRKRNIESESPMNLTNSHDVFPKDENPIQQTHIRTSGFEENIINFPYQTPIDPSYQHTLLDQDFIKNDPRFITHIEPNYDFRFNFQLQQRAVDQNDSNFPTNLDPTYGRQGLSNQHYQNSLESTFQNHSNTQLRGNTTNMIPKFNNENDTYPSYSTGFIPDSLFTTNNSITLDVNSLSIPNMHAKTVQQNIITPFSMINTQIEPRIDTNTILGSIPSSLSRPTDSQFNLQSQSSLIDDPFNQNSVYQDNTFNISNNLWQNDNSFGFTPESQFKPFTNSNNITSYQTSFKPSSMQNSIPISNDFQKISTSFFITDKDDPLSITSKKSIDNFPKEFDDKQFGQNKSSTPVLGDDILTSSMPDKSDYLTIKDRSKLNNSNKDLKEIDSNTSSNIDSRNNDSNNFNENNEPIIDIANINDTISFDSNTTTLSMYYNSLVTIWMEYYDMYLVPSHSMLPVERKKFQNVVPILLKDLMFNNESSKINNFFLSSLLCVSAYVSGDLAHTETFYQKARKLAGELFDIIDYRVGLGFIFLCYYNYITMETEKCGVYLNLANNVASYFGPSCHLSKQCVVVQAYVANSVDKRISYFEMIGQNENTTFADIIWSNVGAATSRVEKDNSTAESQLKVVDEALKLINQENVNNGTVNMWHWFFVHTSRIYILLRSGNIDEALESSLFVINKTSHNLWRFFNIALKTRVLMYIGEVFASLPEDKLFLLRNQSNTLISKIDEMLRFPFASHHLSDIKNKIETKLKSRITKNGDTLDQDRKSLNSENFQNNQKGIYTQNSTRMEYQNPAWK